ncbi:MAG: hypothetical protein ABII82_04640, partial [Verrucomicrobiota bacterium]
PTSNGKPLLAAAAATLLLAAAIVHFTSQPSGAPANTGSPRAPATTSTASARPATSLADDNLQSILAETDPARRQALLRAWADRIDSADMAGILAELHTLESAELRAEIRQALLYSWTTRDLVAVAQWFGTLGPAHDLQQEGRDQLVLALLQCDRDAVILALRESLPETTSRQLYGPFFRAWAQTDPATAGAKLLELADTETGNPLMWHDLISQVAAQWIETDSASAVAWVQTLPENSPAKIKAQLQASYRWTELDPVAASTYAAGAKNLQLVKTVAGKWAETDHAAALDWGKTLSEPIAQARALSGAAGTWARTDPRAAAAYAATIEQPVLRSDVTASVTSAWAFSDPQAAGDWLRTLPADTSRDLAVGVLCEALRFTAPDQAFNWAAAIAEPEIRANAQMRTAVTWLRQEPEIARAAVAGSALPEEMKTSIYAQATPPKPRG